MICRDCGRPIYLGQSWKPVLPTSAAHVYCDARLPRWQRLEGTFCTALVRIFDGHLGVFRFEHCRRPAVRLGETAASAFCAKHAKPEEPA